MDLNELLHEHQVAVMKAAASGNGPARDNHFAKVAEYAERVRALRTIEQGAKIEVADEDPPTIIYGTYAGHTSERATLRSLRHRRPLHRGKTRAGQSAILRALVQPTSGKD